MQTGMLWDDGIQSVKGEIFGCENVNEFKKGRDGMMVYE